MSILELFAQFTLSRNIILSVYPKISERGKCSILIYLRVLYPRIYLVNCQIPAQIIREITLTFNLNVIAQILSSY